MKIQWIGGTTFLLKNSTGKQLLLNPNKLIFSTKKYNFNPNIITCCNTCKNDYLKDFISKDCKIINSVCTFNNEFLKLKSYTTFRDNVNGMKRGENIIYILEIDGFKLCHLGSIGHMINYELLSVLKDLDFLFIPIGGHFCLNGFEASKLAYSINAKYIIPMYFKTSYEYFYLDGPFKFLSSMKNIITYKDSAIQTNDLPLSGHNSVILLNNLL